MPAPNRYDESNQVATAADQQFDLELVLPDKIQHLYRDHTRGLIHHPNTTHYAVLTTDTRLGPFVCIIPLDGTQAVHTPGLIEYLVHVARDELARRFNEEISPCAST